MISSPERTRIAVIGPRGIGAVHVRVLVESGAELCAILSSSMETASLTAKSIEDEFNIKVTPYCSFEEMLLQENICAVSICAPPEKHYEYIVKALDSKLAVFCEKPLFWHPGEKRNEIRQKLLFLKSHKNRRIFVNTSNSSFLRAIENEMLEKKQIKSFFFRFYTQGRYRYENIAQDLLPHGLSLLLELGGVKKIENVKHTVKAHTFMCQFDYSGINVKFDFHEHPEGPKIFEFKINGIRYERVQTGSGKTYEVFIKDHRQNILIRVEDPFRVFINDFLMCCEKGMKPKDDMFAISAANLSLMSDLIL